MAIDLYSKATLDTLLAAKLADAPSDGSQYARQDGAWEVVIGSGGSFLPLAGGAMDADAEVTLSDTSNHDSELAGWGFGVQLTSDHAQGTTLEYNGLDVYDSAGHMNVAPTGLTFPDATVQTTAYTGGIPTAQKTKVNMYTSNAYFDGSYLRVYVGVSDITSNFSSGGRWFGTVYSSTFNPVNSVGNATDSTGRPYAQVSCVGAGGSIDSGTPLYYTEDGGTTWTSADLPIY